MSSHQAHFDHSQVSTKIADDPNPGNPLLESKLPLPVHTVRSVHAHEMLSMNSIIKTERTEHLHQESEGSMIDNGSSAELSFDFSITTGRILDCFAAAGISLGFNLIEEESSHATMVKQKKHRFLDLFNCLNLGGADDGVTAVKIIVRTNQAKSQRTAKLRGLVGAREEVKKLIDEFKLKSKLLKESQHGSYFEDELEEADPMSSNPFQVEVCADYAFYKILSLEKYGLGKKLAQDIYDFKNAFKNVEQSAALAPVPIKNLYTIIGEVVDSLFKEFNSGRKEMEKVMPYCRVSVEKYVCEKLHGTIYPIYQHRDAQLEVEFTTRRQRILNECSVKDIYSQIGLSRKHWLVLNEPQSYSRPLTFKDLRQKVRKKVTQRAAIPYFKALEQFQKIESTQNIRQKIKFCQLMYTKIKSLVFDYSNGKEELNNIEDILPITILVVLLSDVKNLRAELDIMADFLSFEPNEHQSEKRLLTNLSESYNFIRRDWRLPN